jgi:hypothetical protein
VHAALGDAFKIEDFKDDPDLSDIEMPTYESYEDDNDGAYTSLYPTLMTLILTLMITT